MRWGSSSPRPPRTAPRWSRPSPPPTASTPATSSARCATASGSRSPPGRARSRGGSSGSATSATTTFSTSRPRWPASSSCWRRRARRSSAAWPSAAHWKCSNTARGPWHEDGVRGGTMGSPTWSAAPGTGAPKVKQRVLVRERIADAGIELLRERYEVDVDSNGDLGERIGRYDAIIIRSATKLTAEVLERAEQLKVIGRAGVGVDNVDIDAATRRGIVVANAPESTVVSAAEHTIALLLALARHVPEAHAALKEGRWERSKFGGIELAGKTLGVLGFGRIGQQVARRALALEMRVVAYDPFVGKERFRELGVERAETADELYAQASFLTIHLPLTDETRNALDGEAFAKMQDGVRIVNAARGELVDEEALA